MNRRAFLGAVAVLPAASILRGQGEGPAGFPVEDFVETATPAPDGPTVAVCHVGFRPKVGRKMVIVRNPHEPFPSEFIIQSIDSQKALAEHGGDPLAANKRNGGGEIERNDATVPRTSFSTRPLTPVRSDMGLFLVGDFTDVDRPGMYQVGVGGQRVYLKESGDTGISKHSQWQGGERSVPSVISEDAWRRTLPRAISYIHSQRCGQAVPGVHRACHLDDGRLSSGEHSDATGGWHDAGDVRKGVAYTALMGIGLLKVLQNLTAEPGDVPADEILDEVRHGNKYFLKMQGKDGKVCSGIGMNEWTDNVIGTADDRPINTTRTPESTSAIFATLEALAAKCYAKPDPEYSAQCLRASVRAFQTLDHPSTMAAIARWTIAACELYRATHESAYEQKALQLGRDLILRQNTVFLGDQKQIRGFWMEGEKPFVHLVDGGVPPLAIAELCHTFPQASDRQRWMDALQLHVDEYMLPMAERSPYRIMPVGVYLGSPTPETYRSLAGRLTFRFFMPVREKYWWLGTSSHLLSNALFLGRFAQLKPGGHEPYVELAYHQMEWIMGSNPFGACLMTGVGARNPMPFSVFNGAIIGGVMNGIGGNTADEPVLNQGPDLDWRTGEYWSPHNAYYLWANSVLEQIT